MHPPLIVLQTQGLISALVRGQVKPDDLAQGLFAISGTRDNHMAAIPAWVQERTTDPDEAKRLTDLLARAYAFAEEDRRLVWRGPSDRLILVLDRLLLAHGLPSLLATYQAARDDIRTRLGAASYRARYGQFNPDTGQNGRTIERGLQVGMPGIRVIS